MNYCEERKIVENDNVKDYVENRFYDLPRYTPKPAGMNQITVNDG